MLKAELKVTGGTHADKLIPLVKQRFLIGRGEDCNLRPASEQISRHHCVFSVDDFTVRLRDLGSTNGTFVNGAQLRGEIVLKHGDTVQFGSLTFEMRISSEQVSYDSNASATIAESVLPQAGAPDTAELAAGDTALDIPAATVENDSSSQTVELPDSTPTAAPTPEQPALPPEGASSNEQPQQSPGAQPYPPQPAPGAAPYPPAGYPYPPQPGMGYPQQPYPYPGYMPMPGQYPQQPYPYPPAGQYPQPGEAETTNSEPENTVAELPVRLPPPESTGAVDPVEKPAAEEGDNGETVAADPSTRAAEAIRNMRNRRPGSE